MDTNKIDEMRRHFDALAHHEDGELSVEFWKARELQVYFGYEKWENFEVSIHRAMTACENAGVEVTDHFRISTEVRLLGKGAKRKIDDFDLTRYACYLIAQNGDPRKAEIAFAQSYFAVQTRRTELISDRIAYIERSLARNRLKEAEKQLSQNIYERGVDDAGFGRIRSKGDAALFGGLTTAEMKSRLQVKPNRPLADFLPTLTIAAKNLATEMTNYNVEQNDLQGEISITAEHVQNNRSVRGMLQERGIIPENLPPAEDFAKQERRALAEEKKLAHTTPKLPPVTVKASSNPETALSEDDKKLLDYLKEHPQASSSDVETELGIKKTLFLRKTTMLREAGLLRRVGKSRNGRWEVK